MCGGAAALLPSASLGPLGLGRKWQTEDASRLLYSCWQTVSQTGSSCSWPGLHAIMQPGLVLQTDAGTNGKPIMQTLKLTGECVHFAPGSGFMVIFADPAHHFS